jgi:hypothetical protein
VFAEEGEVKVERATAVGATESSADAALSKAGTRAARRRVAAQTSFFDLANQKVVDELREANIDEMSAEEAKDLIAALRKKLL